MVHKDWKSNFIFVCTVSYCRINFIILFSIFKTIIMALIPMIFLLWLQRNSAITKKSGVPFSFVRKVFNCTCFIFFLLKAMISLVTTLNPAVLVGPSFTFLSDRFFKCVRHLYRRVCPSVRPSVCNGSAKTAFLGWFSPRRDLEHQLTLIWKYIWTDRWSDRVHFFFISTSFISTPSLRYWKNLSTLLSTLQAEIFNSEKNFGKFFKKIPIFRYSFLES